MRENCYITLCRTEDFDGELNFEVLLNEEKPTEYPYIAGFCIFPHGFTYDKEVFIINVSVFHFGFPLEDRRNCGIYAQKVPGKELTLAIYLENKKNYRLFYPLRYKLFEKDCIAIIKQEDLL